MGHDEFIDFLLLRYAIMMECWKTEPDDRPSFEALCMQISELKARANQVI